MFFQAVDTMSPVSISIESSSINFIFDRYREIVLYALVLGNESNLDGIDYEWNVYTIENGTYVGLSILTNDRSDLFIESKLLNCGIYNVSVSVRLATSNMLGFTSVLLKIVRSPIIVRLEESYGSRMSRGYLQNLILDPGKHSIDRTAAPFPLQVGFALSRQIK